MQQQVGCDCRFHDLNAIERRYPRLLRAMRWATILSISEATCCIRDLKHGWMGGEAVHHFGGPKTVIHAAIRCRRSVNELIKLGYLKRS